MRSRGFVRYRNLNTKIIITKTKNEFIEIFIKIFIAKTKNEVRYRNFSDDVAFMNWNLFRPYCRHSNDAKQAETSKTGNRSWLLDSTTETNFTERQNRVCINPENLYILYINKRV